MEKKDAGGAYFIALTGGSNIGGKSLVVVFPRENVINIIDFGGGMNSCRNGDNIYLPDEATLDKIINKHPHAKIRLFLTHSHFDHIGMVARLMARHPQTEAYATEPTAALIPVVSEDSFKIRNESGLPLHYTMKEIDMCMDKINIIRSSDWRDLGGGFQVRFEPSGHIRGAATVLLATPYGIFADSGDVSFHDTTTVRGASMKLTDKVRWLSLETTNGDVTLPDPKIVSAEMLADVLRVVKAGGNVVVPAFSQGRGPDMGIWLGRELRALGITVYSGGLLRKVTEVYSKTKWESDIPFNCDYHQDYQKKPVFNLYPENIRWINMKNCSSIASRKGRLGSVVVAPNGMLEAGYAQYFFANWASDEKNAIFLPGYQAEGTGGRELLTVKRGDAVSVTFPITGESMDVTVRAEVKQYRFSGHADGDQLAVWTGNMGTDSDKSLDKLIMVHGEEEGQLGFRKKLERLPNRPEEILDGTNGRIIML